MEENNEIRIDIMKHEVDTINKKDNKGNIGKLDNEAEPLLPVTTIEIDTVSYNKTVKNSGCNTELDIHVLTPNYSLTHTLKKMRKYRWLHKIAADYYDKWNNIITTPTILFSAATSILTVASIDPVILAIISGLGTTLLAVSTYLKLSSKHMNHLVAAEGYDNIVTMIDFERKFPSQDIKNFASSIEKKILEIKKTTHYLPPEFVYNRYVKKKELIEGN